MKNRWIKTKSWESYLPSDSVSFLTHDELLEIHARLIDRFGGEAGIRDLGLLDSALFRPQTGYYKDLVEMSAALFESLIMNHPFVDGNKRVAFFATDVFLRLNGYKLEVAVSEAHPFLVGLLEKGECNFETLLPWLRRSIIRI